MLPSTEEELQHHLERKAEREVDRLLAAAEAKTVRQDRATQAEVARQAHKAGVIATFAKRAKDATIATRARATEKEAKASRKAAAADAETSFAYSIAMQE